MPWTGQVCRGRSPTPDLRPVNHATALPTPVMTFHAKRQLRSRFQPLAHRAAPFTAWPGRKNATDPAVDSVRLGVRYLAALIACRRKVAPQPELLAAGPARTSLLLLGRVQETIAESN